MTRAAEGTKTVLMPLGPTAGEDPRVMASPPERIKRFEPVSQVGDECVRDSLAGVQAHLMSSSKGIQGSPVTALTWRQAIEATRYSESAECVETLPLMGLLRPDGSALP
jgi:hypothetical protein